MPMDAGLKQRLIGAAVLVALAVIFLPMLVKEPAPDSGVSDLSMRVPDAPDRGYRTVDLPLVVPAPAPEGGVLAPQPLADGQLPTVDTATAPREAQGQPLDEDLAGEGMQDHPDAAELASARPEPAAPAASAAAPAKTPTPVQAQTPVPPPAQAAQTPPAPARPLPAATAGGDYVVHFGAFGSERDAQLIVRQLAQSGLTAYSEPFPLEGRPAQRVRLGPFASREAAEAVRVRAAQVRGDVTPRVLALDAAPSQPARPAATRPAAETPAPARPATAAATRPAEATATPASPPAQAPSAAAGTGFAVQLGAFGNAEEAARLRDRLRGLGIVAFTDTVDTDRGRLTRVKAGPVPGRDEAERLRAQVRSKTGIDGMVRAQP